MHTFYEHSEQLIIHNSYIQCSLGDRRKWHSGMINSSVEGPFTKGYSHLFVKAIRNANFIFKILILQDTVNQMSDEGNYRALDRYKSLFNPCRFHSFGS